jgi:hypothetical protein
MSIRGVGFLKGRGFPVMPFKTRTPIGISPRRQHHAKQLGPKQKLLLPAQEGPQSKPRQLERELRRQLNATRCAAAQERVADAHVAGGCNLIAAVADFAVTVDVKTAE